jgi:hypothetical protein
MLASQPSTPGAPGPARRKEEKKLFNRLTSVAAAALIAAVASAQNQFLINDRTNDAIYRVRDIDANGVIADPAEVFLWFNSNNNAGTLGPQNPSALAVSACRVAVMGDQGNANVYWLSDLNSDGDALDAGESIVFADAANAGGISLAFPTGVSFDSSCAAYIVNAGNASGNDAVYRLVDLNGDGDAQDSVKGVNELTIYVGDGAFGPGNGPYSPQEIFFDSNDVGYLRNSSAGLHGVFRFEDLNSNGRADDAGEFTVFLDSTNAAGIAITAGFGLEPDRSQPDAIFTLQLASGGVDQLVHAADLNSDNDAQDIGETTLVWQSSAANFTTVDVVSLRSGDVLITDNSSLTIVRLSDLDDNGDFMGPGEQTTFYPGAGTLAAVRQLDALCRVGDVNCDGPVNVDDLLAVISDWGIGDACHRANVTCSDGVNVDDLLAVISNWG